jgi:hypothetical protein
MPDPEDPALQFNDNTVQVGDQLETIMSRTKIFNKRIEMGIPEKSLADKDELRRILNKKNFYPDPKSPNLLTWMEKQTIKKLHKEDPNDWTFERLSECFPITALDVKVLLKNKKLNKIRPDKIQFHDDKAKNNWKLLVKGQLENSKEISDHLAQLGHTIYDGPTKFISSAVKQQLEQSILQDYEASLQPSRPKLTGEFGSIIANYKKKVDQLQLSSEEKSVQVVPLKNIVEVKNLLDSELDFEASLGEPSPYGGTTLVNAVTNSRGDNRKMTVMDFRKTFLSELKFKSKNDDPNAKKYFQWLRRENKQFSVAHESKPAQIESDFDNYDSGFNLPSSPSEKYAVKEDYEETLVAKNSSDKREIVLTDRRSGAHFNNLDITDYPLKIDIPNDVFKESATYQVNDCFYDSNGDFLHRIPGAAASV